MSNIGPDEDLAKTISQVFHGWVKKPPAYGLFTVFYLDREPRVLYIHHNLLGKSYSPGRYSFFSCLLFGWNAEIES